MQGSPSGDVEAGEVVEADRNDGVGLARHLETEPWAPGVEDLAGVGVEQVELAAVAGQDAALGCSDSLIANPYSLRHTTSPVSGSTRAVIVASATSSMSSTVTVFGFTVMPNALPSVVSTRSPCVAPVGTGSVYYVDRNVHLVNSRAEALLGCEFCSRVREHSSQLACEGRRGSVVPEPCRSGWRSRR